MKPFDENASAHRIIRLKRRFGWNYGMIAGIAFGIASWGWDAYMLSASHAYHPWLMLVVGLTFCAILGGVCGLLTARSDSSLRGVFYWAIASVILAWLMVALPLKINPAIVSKLDPELGALLNYTDNSDFSLRLGTFLMWITPFMLLVGVAQLPLTDSAVFAASFFGRAAPFLFCILLMVISGTFTDNLINAHFREAIISLDETIQFLVDNQGNEKANPDLARQLHTRAFWDVKEQVQESRSMFVGGYDESLGEIHVLVKFGDQWVDCLVLYNQPSFCKPAGG